MRGPNCITKTAFIHTHTHPPSDEIFQRKHFLSAPIKLVDLIYVSSTYWDQARCVYNLSGSGIDFGKNRVSPPPRYHLKWLWIGWGKLKWKLKWNVQYPVNVTKIVQEGTMQLSKKRCKGPKPQHDQRSERVVANWRNIGARTCFTGTRGGWDAVNVIKGKAIIVLRLMTISF